MTHDKFNNFVEKELGTIRDTLVRKGDEYNKDADRLEFFKKSAALLGGTSEQALYGFLLKHIVSITEMIQNKDINYDFYAEKCGDIISYCILLLALVKEENEQLKEIACDSKGAE